MEYTPWFPDDKRSAALEIEMEDLPIPQHEASCCDKIFLIIFMSLPPQITWVLLWLTRDLVILSQAYPVLYTIILSQFSYCFIEFQYEIYIKADMYTFRSYIISSILFFFLGLIGSASWVLTWIFLPTMEIEVYREAAPEFTQTWMGVLYMILAMILSVVFQPLLETVLYYLVADICFKNRWFWRIVGSLIWSFLPVGQLYFLIEPTKILVMYQNKWRWIWYGITYALGLVFHLVSYCIREKNILRQFTLKTGVWLGLYQAKMSIYWGWFTFKTVQLTQQYSKENVFGKF